MAVFDDMGELGGGDEDEDDMTGPTITIALDEAVIDGMLGGTCGGGDCGNGCGDSCSGGGWY